MFLLSYLNDLYRAIFVKNQRKGAVIRCIIYVIWVCGIKYMTLWLFYIIFSTWVCSIVYIVWVCGIALASLYFRIKTLSVMIHFDYLSIYFIPTTKLY